MTLEQQVISLDLAKRLKELGVKQKSFWTWHTRLWQKSGEPEVYLWPAYGFSNNSAPSGRTHKTNYNEDASAFTVAELGEMLPTGQFWKDESNDKLIRTFRAQGENKYWWCELAQGTEVYPAPMAKPIHREVEITEADARAKMLVYLLENKLIKPQ